MEHKMKSSLYSVYTQLHGEGGVIVFFHPHHELINHSVRCTSRLESTLLNINQNYLLQASTDHQLMMTENPIYFTKKSAKFSENSKYISYRQSSYGWRF
jgi:hypothetical protein